MMMMTGTSLVRRLGSVDVNFLHDPFPILGADYIRPVTMITQSHVKSVGLGSAKRTYPDDVKCIHYLICIKQKRGFGPIRLYK